MPLPPPPPTLLRNASLFLDFDGTLVRIADHPDEVLVERQLLSLLEMLTGKLSGRVVLISGRAAEDVRRRIEPIGIEVAGSHGLERARSQVEPHPWTAEATALVRELEARHQGVLVEQKPLGVALHFRQAPQAEDDCRDAAEELSRLTGLAIQPGKMVFELKPPSGDKGTALREIMAEPQHAGTVPVFVGDDLTDEHGFAAAVSLGGAGILVGKERDTAARYRLADVDAVHTWLSDAVEALA